MSAHASPNDCRRAIPLPANTRAPHPGPVGSGTRKAQTFAPERERVTCTHDWIPRLRFPPRAFAVRDRPVERRRRVRAPIAAGIETAQALSSSASRSTTSDRLSRHCRTRWIHSPAWSRVRTLSSGRGEAGRRPRPPVTQQPTWRANFRMSTRRALPHPSAAMDISIEYCTV